MVRQGRDHGQPRPSLQPAGRGSTSPRPVGCGLSNQRRGRALLISDSYRKLNSDLHAGGNYGRHGDKWADHVRGLIRRYDAQTVLDYGCGQGSLGRALGDIVREYDPAIPEKAEVPSAADIVVCTDVLEHVEPHCLNDVLDHLRALTHRASFVVIATRPAKKVLADGRNAHLIIEPSGYWCRHLDRRFRTVSYEAGDGEFAAVLEPLRGWAAFRGRLGVLADRWRSRGPA